MLAEAPRFPLNPRKLVHVSNKVGKMCKGYRGQDVRCLPTLAMFMGLRDEFQSSQILCCPSRLYFNHALEGANGKGVPIPCKRHCYPSSILVCIASMATALATKCKTVMFESATKLAGRQRAQCAIVNLAHRVTATAVPSVMSRPSPVGSSRPSSMNSSTIMESTS